MPSALAHQCVDSPLATRLPAIGGAAWGRPSGMRLRWTRWRPRGRCWRTWEWARAMKGPEKDVDVDSTPGTRPTRVDGSSFDSREALFTSVHSIAEIAGWVDNPLIDASVLEQCDRFANGVAIGRTAGDILDMNVEATLR